MQPPILSISRRTRRTPFTRRVTEAGVKGYTVYNHMLLPTFFRSVEEDYWHLREAVQIWDVSCERQVEVRGPDSQRLMQLLTPRDLSEMPIGQCYYIPIVDETGGMLNDPVALKLADDRYWISVADSDLLFWVKGLAAGLRLDVAVDEPDVSPLAVQGPKADDVVADVFGDQVRSIKFFRFEPLLWQGHEYMVARSGYSKQGGFEIYVPDTSLGEPLWDAIVEAGKPHDIHAGGPNLIERVEGGLLSYGNDMTRENTPHECGLGRFCQTADAIGCIGRDALIRVIMEGPNRQIRGLRIDADDVANPIDPYQIICQGEAAGQVTSAAWSPRLKTTVAIGMIESAFWEPGTQVTVETPKGPRPAEVVTLPFPQ
ncbi:MAG: dimethylsulfoniopropionate demethylase [Alphaproteobacteria bacterium]